MSRDHPAIYCDLSTLNFTARPAIGSDYEIQILDVEVTQRAARDIATINYVSTSRRAATIRRPRNARVPTNVELTRGEYRSACSPRANFITVT